MKNTSKKMANLFLEILEDKKNGLTDGAIYTKAQKTYGQETADNIYNILMAFKEYIRTNK